MSERILTSQWLMPLSASSVIMAILSTIHFEHKFWQLWNELLHKPMIVLNKRYCVLIKLLESLLQTNDYIVI